MAVTYLFAFLLLVVGSTARHARHFHAKHEKARKYSVPYPQPVVIQGTSYPDCGGNPCASSAPYPGSEYQQQATSQCCPSGGTSCCGTSTSPPCCITIQPFNSKNLTVNAPSKVTLELNILPVKASTAKPTSGKPTTKPGAATKPPGATTKPPGATTKPPGATTKPPGATTKPPGATTKPPGATTKPPGATTKPPGATTKPPSATTKPPGATTKPPGATTKPPTTKPPRGLSADQATGENNMQHFRAEALAESNRERSIHLFNGLSDFPGNLQNKLVLDEGLNIAAQRYAKKIAAERRPAHSDPATRPKQGENIAVACNNIGRPLSGKVAAGMWYHEVKGYNWGMPGYTPKTGHFTQAVWKGSKRVGFGRARYTNDKDKICSVVVARYAPRGNIKGLFPQNVLRGNYMNI